MGKEQQGDRPSTLEPFVQPTSGGEGGSLQIQRRPRSRTTFETEIHRILQQYKITQRRFGEAIGASQSHLSLTRIGKRSMSEDMRHRAISALETFGVPQKKRDRLAKKLRSPQYREADRPTGGNLSLSEYDELFRRQGVTIDAKTLAEALRVRGPDFVRNAVDKLGLLKHAQGELKKANKEIKALIALILQQLYSPKPEDRESEEKEGIREETK